MASRPNLVFMMPDQLRPDFLSCYGAQGLRTPNIDAIAGAGVRFDNALSASPVCVPARVSLLTGMNALRNGVADNLRTLRADHRQTGVRTWPEILAEEAGYATAAVGKMHFYPWDARLGFGYRVIAEDKRWLQVRDDYYHFLRERGERKYHGNEHDGYHANKGAVVSRLPAELSPDRFTADQAARFIRTYGGEQPFALMIGFPSPHCPYDPAAEYLDRVDPARLPEAVPDSGDAPGLRATTVAGNRRSWNGVDYSDFPGSAKRVIRHHYAALVCQLDDEVGRVTAALHDAGVAEDTVVVFASDHGDYLGDHDLIGKASFYDGAVRVPLLVSGPGVEGGQASDELVELTDVTPTLLAMAGCALPAYMDARPLPGPGLPGERGRERIFGLLSGGWMNFDGRWKLHRYASGELLLHDLADDPSEQRNRAADPACAALLRRLDAELTAEVMRSARLAMHDRLAAAGDLSSDPAFGREGWQRPWPHPVQPG